MAEDGRTEQQINANILALLHQIARQARVLRPKTTHSNTFSHTHWLDSFDVWIHSADTKTNKKKGEPCISITAEEVGVWRSPPGSRHCSVSSGRRAGG
eukprot:822017-Rhodomonas_salina.1